MNIMYSNSIVTNDSDIKNQCIKTKHATTKGHANLHILNVLVWDIVFHPPVKRIKELAGELCFVRTKIVFWGSFRTATFVAMPLLLSKRLFSKR